MSLVQDLRKTIRGGIFLPGDDRYDLERRSWHLAIDPRPAVIVEAADRADVRACLVAAREHAVPFAVQATGHGTLTPADGGVLVKTSPLAAVEVDPRRRTARVGPGARWSAVIDAAEPYGLAPLSGTASIGVTGYTLGGGLGWLSRAYGFAADSLIRAEVVTADGRIVAASAEEHPDLFWALRGGGANFGIVTSLEFRLYPVARVYAGMSLHAIDRAPATLTRYRDWADEEPDELTTAVTLLQMPPAPGVPEPLRGRRVLAVRALYLGEAEPAERLLRPLLDAAGPPIMGGFRSMTFAETSTITGPPPPPTAVEQHLDLFRALPDAALDVLLEKAGEGADPTLAAVELRHWGGAMSRPAPDAGPAGHRDVPFSALAGAPFDPATGRDIARSQMDDLRAKLWPHATGGSFLNFLADPAMTESAFTTTNYRRLAEVKRVWDPDNAFRVNHNIPPVPAPALGAASHGPVTPLIGQSHR